MRHNKLGLYIHLVWTTWDRLPLISEEIERPLHRQLENAVRQTGCKVLALNGVPDHVHLLVELMPTVALAKLV